MFIRKPKYEAVINKDEEPIINTSSSNNDIYDNISNTDVTTTITRNLFTPSCLWSSSFTLLLIATYYIPSISLTFYQRWLFQSFHFPLTTVLIHMLVKYLLATFIRLIIASKRGKKRILLNWKEYIIAVAPVGISSGLDIGLSNWGLELMQVSLYTMTKSTTIVFILFFSILFKLEKKSWSLCTIVVMITVGLILFTYKATQFNFFGFILLLLASMSSGVRWTCVQLLLQKSKMGMKSPIDMIYHMQPWMIVSVLPFALWMEGASVIRNCQLFRYNDYGIFLHILFKVLIGAFIAFFMEFTEVMVITYTSSLTLAIAGIFKEVFILVLAVQWNGDQMSLINVIGLLTCLCGIILHVIHKVKTIQMQQFATEKTSYDLSTERFELGENLIGDDDDGGGGVERNHFYLQDDSDDEKSDSQIIFDILKRRGDR